MSKPRQSGIPAPALYKIVLVDMLASIATVLGVLLFEPAWLTSTLTGLSVFLIPNLIFIRQAFRFCGAGQAKQVVRSFYQAEAAKFALTVLLFAYSFSMLTLHEPIVVFVVYGVFWTIHQLTSHRVISNYRI